MAFSLSPIGNEQQANSNGAPLSGGLLYTYLAGSTTPAPTYTDSTGTTPQANPVVLNTLGRPTDPLWLPDGVAYKFVLTSSAGAAQWTIDNITGVSSSIPTQDEWVLQSTVPTYINATQFSVPGDQVSIFTVGRRIRAVCTGGVRYGYISVSDYTSLTTVTLVLDAGTLDSGISAVSVGLLSSTDSSMPWIKSSSTGLTAQGALTVVGVTTLAGDAVSALQAVPKQQLDSAVSNTIRVTTRQTVLSGPVDSNGALALAGSTGSTTVTGSGTIVATAAYGSDARGDIDRVASITNPSWTGLSTNGTMYLYLTIGTDGTATPGASATAPIYQRAGTYSTTSGAWTYNYAEHVGKLGNGSSADQVSRVYVGEVTVSGGVVSAISWYALRGEYEGPWFVVSAADSVSRAHNIGVPPLHTEILVSESGGANPRALSYRSAVVDLGVYFTSINRLAAAFTALDYVAINTSGSAVTSIYYKLIMWRGW